jgi:signal transduction histidine kinase
LSSSGLTLAGALVDLLTVATGVGLGDGTRNRIAAAAANEARLVQLAREEERRADEAVAEERTRIARELHDLVAHSISVVAVQAGMGHHLIDQDPAKAKEALATIEQASRQSLTEMRRMLGILRTRTDTPANDLAPQPSLRSLDVLVDQIRRAGVPVDVTIGGEPRPLSSGTDLSAYRIVQEALTNVMKHAGDAAVRIEIRYAPDGLHLTIDDDGRGLSAQPNEDGGFGLVGMRERAAVVSGNVATGPRPGGGFRVAAHLPYEGALT